MSYEAARNAIQARVAAAWTATTIAYDNVPFDPPAATAWARCRVLNTLGGPASLGGPTIRYRAVGLVSFGIFSPEGTGPTVPAGLVDDAVAIFEGQNLAGGVRFENVYAVDLGQDPEGPWYRVDVIAAFRFDAIR